MTPLRKQARECRMGMWKSLVWAVLTWIGIAGSTHWLWILTLCAVSGLHVVGFFLWRRSAQKWLELAERDEDLDRRLANELAYCIPRGTA